jgi:hypothetical protein
MRLMKVFGWKNAGRVVKMTYRQVLCDAQHGFTRVKNTVPASSTRFAGGILPAM